MATKTDSKITIANIIALAGLAGLGVVSFFGSLLHSSDGSPGGAALGAIALVLVLGALLFLGIYAKKAYSNAEKWRMVEWGCLLAYIVVAALSAGPFLRFFFINSEKEHLQALAKEETKAIRNLYQNYNRQCEQFIKEASGQIENFKDSKSKSANDSLSKYVEDRCTDMAYWRTKALAVVKVEEDPELDELEAGIASWKLMQLPSLASRLAEKDNTSVKSLNEKIAAYGRDNSLIPVVIGSKTMPYRLEGYAQFDLPDSPKPLFANALQHADGKTTTGWIVYVLLHLLVLFNLLVAPRSVDVNPLSRKRNTGGLDL